MKTLLAIAVFVFASSFAAFGCASMSNVKADRASGNGVAQVYATNESTAWDAARDVLKSEGASTVEEDKAQHCLWAEFPAGGFSSGTSFGSCFDVVDASHVRVTAISRRHYQLGAITRLSEGGFHEKLAQKLATSPATSPASSTTTTAAAAQK